MIPKKPALGLDPRVTTGFRDKDHAQAKQWDERPLRQVMTARGWRVPCTVFLVMAGLGAGPLLAADPAYDPGQAVPSIAGSLPDNGAPGGVRQRLSDRG